MAGLFFIALLVCFAGLVRPFGRTERTGAFTRKHFGWGAAAAFVGMMITVPPVDETASASTAEVADEVSDAEGAGSALNDSEEIEELSAQVASVPAAAVEENLRIYERLVKLAPADDQFRERRDHYEARSKARERYRSNPEEALEIVEFDWSKGGFGSVMIIDRLVIRNDAPFDVKDFVIKCIHSASSGTEMDRNSERLYEVVPAGETRTFRDVRMGFIHSQAQSTSCSFTDAEPV